MTTMKTIYADYNAATEAGYLCLTTRGAQADIERLGARPGDWAWLSDSEVVVGAQLAIDDYYGLVGIPDWDTLVHLDDEGAADFNLVSAELDPLLTKEPSSEADEPRVFQLLTQLERVAPPHIRDASPGMLAFRRALALRQMGKLGLALLEAEEARRARPDDPVLTSVYLELLRLEDLPSAVTQAEIIAESPSVSAPVLSACINILATRAEQAADDQFGPMAERILAWCGRLDQAPDRDLAGPSLLALSYFNRGFVLLREGRISQARQAFERSHQLYPVGPLLHEAAGLQMYDRHAREVARQVRTIAEHYPDKPVAA
jgi:tetratricopeptide (TPR) repeat protein